MQNLEEANRTLNYKRKYEPDFPTVSILATVRSRSIAATELQSLGMGCA